MSESPSLRLTLGISGVAVWSPGLFGTFDRARFREFLSRAFAVREVQVVELQPAAASGRIRYGAVKNPAQIWRKLSRALGSSETERESVDAVAVPRVDARNVYLGGVETAPIRVTRIGEVLSTWRVREQSENALKLSHPILRHRREVVFRLEEELAGLLGVQDFSTNALTAAVSIRFDRSALTAERLAYELEKAWPRLLEGLDGPPSKTRLVAAAGLVGLSYAGQYVVPSLRPAAVAAVAIYGAPNVVNAAKDLAHGKVGLPVLYSTGLTFLLISGLPFGSSVVSLLMQAWPHLARGRIEKSQRRLFSAHRRRPRWAHARRANGEEVEVNVEALRRDELVVVRRGDIVPVDGVVSHGLAAVVEEPPFSHDRVTDKARGDTVRAGAFVRDGSLTIRVERTGSETVAARIDSLLPHTAVATPPALLEVERIANRNAKAALALSAATLFFARTLRPAQAAIRPDYSTGPRISAQLSTLRAIADGLRRGVLFRNRAAIDLLATTSVFVVDDSAGAEESGLGVTRIDTASDVSPALVVGYAFAVRGSLPPEQSAALLARAKQRKIARVKVVQPERLAGRIRYRDQRGSVIEIATPAYLEAAGIAEPQRVRTVRVPGTSSRAARATAQSASLAPTDALWVLRDGTALGRVYFARTADSIGGRALAALRAQNRRARIVYVSHRSVDAVRAVAGELGVDSFHAGLSHADKAGLVRSLAGNVVWIGDGSDPRVRELMASSGVSVSVAPPSTEPDEADVLLSCNGLAGVPDAIAISRAHRGRLKRDYRIVYVANLLGVAGAFLSGFGSLHVGLLSNAGTGLIYARHLRALARAVAAAEKQRTRRRRLPPL